VRSETGAPTNIEGRIGVWSAGLGRTVFSAIEDLILLPIQQLAAYPAPCLAEAWRNLFIPALSPTRSLQGFFDSHRVATF